MTVHAGERVVICGPSGSGKSTLIRCFNALEHHSAGKLVVDGIEVYEGSKQIRKLRQEVGMVFQQFNLFPHLTVLENLTIGPMRVRKVSPRPRPRQLLIDIWSGCIFPNRPTNTPASCPVVSSSEWPLHDHCAWSPASCSLMNQPPRLIRR